MGIADSPLLNRAWYLWRRSSWMVDPRRLLSDYTDVPVRRPIFFLGNQGDGLTFVSRMVRRHPDVVSVTGGHRYWTGADEIQNVMHRRLPAKLALPRRMDGNEVAARLTPPHSWSYAADALLPYYRWTAADVEPGDRERFLRLLREALGHHGEGDRARLRFVDKSQSFSVKLPYLDALLAGTEPYYVLITRNPYATIYRAALGKAGDMRRYSARLSLDERFEICVQHWSNAMTCATQDGAALERFHVMQMERFLTDPAGSLRALADALDLDFRDDMVPGPDQPLPFGTNFMERWYPFRADVNDTYLERIPERFVDIVEQRCGALAGRFGYAPPRG